MMREWNRRLNRVPALLLILIVSLCVVAPRRAVSVSPSGRFQTVLAALQRNGSCIDLPRVGVSTHRGRNPDDVNVKLVSDLGAKIVRIEIPWIDVERAGKFDFSQFDDIVWQLRRSQKSIVLLLAYGHPDHSDGGLAGGFPFVPRTREQRQAYFKYVRATVEHFRGPDITYQIWNEPNLRQFWPLTAPDYATLLAGAAAAIREVDSTAKILAAGIANEQNRDSFSREIIAAETPDQVDALAFHPYRQDAPENSLLDIAEFEKATMRNDRRLPVWITEWGYSESWIAHAYPLKNSRKQQTILTARLILTAALAEAKAVLLYDLIDDGPDMTDPQYTFGLYDYEFHPKPAVHAVKTIIDLMSSCKTYSFQFDSRRKIITATFEDGLRVSHVIWTYDRHPRNICLDPVSSKATHLSDIFGKHLLVERCRRSLNIRVNLREDANPVILTFDR